MNVLLGWARANPLWSRLWLKLGLRMALALALVPALQAIADRYDFSANIAAIAGVVLALLVGARWSDRICLVLDIPPAPTRGT